jgi:hypothetical protein
MYAVFHYRTTSSATPCGNQLQYSQSRSYPLTATMNFISLYLRLNGTGVLTISPVAGVA